MKPFRLLITVLSLGVMFSFSGCGGGGGKGETTQDKQFGMLSSKVWNISAVTLGGVDQTSAWTTAGFKLTISGTAGQTTFNYSCAGRPALGPWPASGTWAFGDDPTHTIVRDKSTADELPMSYTVATGTSNSLQVTFTYSGAGYTRVDNVSGTWVFTFN